MKNKIIYRRECIVVIQKNIRMFLDKKRFKHRIKGIVKIKTLQSQIDAMGNILKQIKCDKEQSSAQQSLNLLKQQMTHSIAKIKVGLLVFLLDLSTWLIDFYELFKSMDRISEKEINQCYNDLFSACDRDLKKLKAIIEQQKNKDEQERLRKIQVDNKFLEYLALMIVIML